MQEEHGAYYTLRSLFGKAVCKHIIIVFVGVDELTKEQGVLGWFSINVDTAQFY